MLHRSLWVVLACLLWAGCDCSRNKDPQNNQSNNNNQNSGNCVEGEKKCDYNKVLLCENGNWRIYKECQVGELTGPLCDPVLLDCVFCYSNGTTCEPDGHVYYCLPNGWVGEKKEDCDLEREEHCIEWVAGEAVCGTACNKARLTKSYLGCDLVAVPTANASLRPQFAENFGIAIDNANDVDVEVRITGPGVNTTEWVPAQTLHVFTLPYHEPLRTGSSPDFGLSLRSGLYPRSAFRITTSEPVTAYQFNPYDYLIHTSGIDYFSYTNDASLLLPVASLGQAYMAMSRATVAYQTVLPPISNKHSPGFLTIVGVEDNTTVIVTSRAHTASGQDISALTPGQQQVYVLQENDVLQLVSSQDFVASECPQTHGWGTETDERYVYCDPGADFDLTGTRVEADKPVAVWSGHNCAFVPYHVWACDHLEEMLFPEETWGSHFVIGFTQQVDIGSAETNLVRVVAATDGTEVTFSPSTISAPRTLAKGEWMEVLPSQQQHFVIESSHPVMVGKFMVGQNYWTTLQNASGDPSFGLVVPTEQFRSEYRFTAPPSFEVSFVNVLVPPDMTASDTITLDGEIIGPENYITIGTTGYAVAQMPLGPGNPTGSHSISSSRESLRFGIEVYGFANYTSYLYPGGLDLYRINVIMK